MKILLMLVVLTTSATAAELPQYEVSGFPITPVQMTVLGATARAREVPPTATLITRVQHMILSQRYHDIVEDLRALRTKPTFVIISDE